MRITFLFDNISNGSKREFYETARELQSSDSIRDTAISVINEAAEQGVTIYDDGVHDKAEAISIYISSLSIKDASTGWEESGFGIKYSLGENGAIKILNGYEPLRHDWTLSELEEIIAAGYIKGDTSKLIIARPIGLGADPQDFFDWLGFFANTLQLASVAVSAPSILYRIVSLSRNRHYRKISRQWQKNGIHYPGSLREFIDTKAEWSLGEVKKRLRLNEEYAIKLLSSLGLEPVNDTWRITHSKQSIANRKRWMRNEKKYKKRAGEEQ